MAAGTTRECSENLQLDQQSLEHLVEGTHADIRQVLNLLSTFRLTSASMTYDQAKDLYGGGRGAILSCRCRLGKAG